MKIFKRGLIIVVVTALLVVSPVGAYLSGKQAGKVYAGEVVATYTIYQALMALLGAFGITYVSSEMISSGWTDGSSALDPVYNDWKKAYDAERFKVIEGGGGSGSGPDLPPTFDALISGIVTKGVVDLTQDVWDCLKTWVTDTVQTSYEMGHSIYQKFHTDVGNIAMPENTYGLFVASKEYIRSDGSKYWDLSPDGNVAIITSTGPFCFYLSSQNELWYVTTSLDTGNLWKQFIYLDSVLISVGDSSRPRISSYVRGSYKPPGSVSKAPSIRFATIPCDISLSSFIKPFVYSGDESADFQEMYDYLLSGDTLPKYNQDTIWTSPEYADSYRGTSPLELPNPPTSPYAVPSEAQIQKLIEGVGDAKTEVDSNVRDEKSSKSVKDFISDMGIDFSVDPIPTPDPSPDPGPDPGPGPDPTPEPGNEAFTADLTKLFPFCIPFDLIYAFETMSSGAVAPKFSIPFKIPSLGVDEKWEIDMSDFDSAVQIFRVMETLGFIVSLIILTRNIIKG